MEFFVAFGLAAAPGPLVAQAERVLEKPCPPRLLNEPGLPFQEAEIACLAFLAAALTSDAVERESTEVGPLLEKLARAALASSAMHPFRKTGWTVLGDKKVPKSVLYRGLLGFVLEATARVSSREFEKALRDSLAASLVVDLRSGWLESFPGRRYPCDHAPAAAALALHGAAPSVATASELVARLDALRAQGLPAEVDRRGRPRAMIRATPYGFAAAFLSVAHPERARRFAEDLFERFCGTHTRLELAGCRESTSGNEPRDSAAGPMLAGFSVGATGLALLAGIAAPDHRMTRALRRSRALFDGGINARDHPLVSAILAYADYGRPWVRGPE